MKIQFNEMTWVLCHYGGGFDGHFDTKAILIEPKPFNVISIKKDKRKQCSDILVKSDGACDGQSVFLINVPNGLFKQIEN